MFLALYLTANYPFIWWNGLKNNIYESKITGAIFEFAALPMVFLGIALPIMAIYLVIKNKGASKAWPILSLAISFITILLISKWSNKELQKSPPKLIEGLYKYKILDLLVLRS